MLAAHLLTSSAGLAQALVLNGAAPVGSVLGILYGEDSVGFRFGRFVLHDSTLRLPECADGTARHATVASFRFYVRRVLHDRTYRTLGTTAYHSYHCR